MYSVRLLGGALLEGPSGPLSGRVVQRRQLAALALLACAREQGLTRGKLLGYLWPDAEEERARRHLSDSLYVLRRALGEDAVLGAGDMLRLNLEVVRCDVCAFEDALKRDDWEAAAGLYKGPFLDGFYLSDAREFEGWVEAERDRLAGEYAKALESLAERSEAVKDYRVAAEWWKKLAAHDPYNSRVVLRLMQALAAAGDPANALECYRGHELRVRDELGLAPPEDLLAFVEQLQKQPTRLRHVAAEATREERPSPEVQVEPAQAAVTPAETATGLRRLILEIHRRSLWQVLGLYIVGAWIAFQVVQTLTEGLGLPDWFPALAAVLLIVFLPVVLATAFTQEGFGARGAAPATPAVTAQPSAEGPSAGARRVLTWRNALLAGLGAFALLGIGTSTYMAMRVMGIGPPGTLIAKGVLEQRERIILADFENRTPDSLLAIAVTEAFRVDLAQSPTVTLVPPRQVRGVLERMQVAPDVPLDLDRASEAAIREGIKAVIAGEIHSVGASYVLSARLVVAENGSELVAYRETADDSTHILPATDQLSKRLRERIGEPLKKIRGAKPLEQVTTSSLEALRKYSQGNRAFAEADWDRASELYKEAIALDTTFGMAYRRLGAAYANMGGHRASYVAAYTKAFELSDRMTERERHVAVATYYASVTQENEKAAIAFQALLDTHPNDRTALNNLGVIYRGWRDYARAEELQRRAIELDSTGAAPYVNAASAQFRQGKFDEARLTIERLAERQPGNPQVQRRLADFASSLGDYQLAEAQLLALREEQKGNPRWRYLTSKTLSDLALAQGKLAEAEHHLRDAVTTAEERDRPVDYLISAISLAEIDLWFRDDSARGLRRVETALERYPLVSIAPLDRPYLSLARFYALGGKLELARETLLEFEATIDTDLRRGSEPTRRGVAGMVAQAEGRLDDAIADFRRSDQGLCGICALPFLGHAYDVVGEADSALAIYERYVTTPYDLRNWNRWRDPFWLPKIHLRLGDLYEQRGDTAKAIYYYGKLVELWKDADPELQPRVEAARRAIEALSPDT